MASVQEQAQVDKRIVLEVLNACEPNSARKLLLEGVKSLDAGSPAAFQGEFAQLVSLELETERSNREKTVENFVQDIADSEAHIATLNTEFEEKTKAVEEAKVHLKECEGIVVERDGEVTKLKEHKEEVNERKRSLKFDADEVSSKRAKIESVSKGQYQNIVDGTCADDVTLKSSITAVQELVEAAFPKLYRDKGFLSALEPALKANPSARAPFDQFVFSVLSKEIATGAETLDKQIESHQCDLEMVEAEALGAEAMLDVAEIDFSDAKTSKKNADTQLKSAKTKEVQATKAVASMAETKQNQLEAKEVDSRRIEDLESAAAALTRFVKCEYEEPPAPVIEEPVEAVTEDATEAAPAADDAAKDTADTVPAVAAEEPVKADEITPPLKDASLDKVEGSNDNLSVPMAIGGC